MAFNIYSTVGQLISNEQTKVIIEKHLPGASSHPQLSMAWHMSLAEVASYPEANISSEKLQALLADLAKVAV